MPGRPPKPLKLLKLQGAYRKDRHGGSLELSAADLKPPTWLKKEGRAEWSRVCRALAESCVLTLADRGALAIYCQAWEDYVAALARVRREGATLETDSGRRYRNPDLQLLRESRDAVHTYGQQLGLTPAARRRVPAGKKRRAMEPGKQEFFEGIA